MNLFRFGWRYAIAVHYGYFITFYMRQMRMLTKQRPIEYIRATLQTNFFLHYVGLLLESQHFFFSIKYKAINYNQVNFYVFSYSIYRSLSVGFDFCRRPIGTMCDHRNCVYLPLPELSLKTLGLFSLFRYRLHFMHYLFRCGMKEQKSENENARKGNLKRKLNRKTVHRLAMRFFFSLQIK